MKTPFAKLLAICTTFIAAAPALAHDSHGLTGSHWHGTDAWGFVALALAAAAALWFSRGGK
jgi:hypothetical protein